MYTSPPAYYHPPGHSKNNSVSSLRLLNLGFQLLFPLYTSWLSQINKSSSFWEAFWPIQILTNLENSSYVGPKTRLSFSSFAILTKKWFYERKNKPKIWCDSIDIEAEKSRERVDMAAKSIYFTLIAKSKAKEYNFIYNRAILWIRYKLYSQRLENL